tara:strand:- start:717 stop:845 length:129 start_codon:yes stop_codon:yes gene_type:complete
MKTIIAELQRETDLNIIYSINENQIPKRKGKIPKKIRIRIIE